MPPLPSIVMDPPESDMPSSSSVQEPARNRLNVPDLAKVNAAREAASRHEDFT